jgi:ATP-binding cassette, subfamily B, multidrug efflux pump
MRGSCSRWNWKHSNFGFISTGLGGREFHVCPKCKVRDTRLKMIGEYGYMEEGKLGKPYDLRLLLRLIHYALPYRRRILLALLLTIFITLLDLALPYLSKIAIDRYILASSYAVRLSAPVREDLARFLGDRMSMSRDGSLCFISHEDIKKLDPALVHDWRNEGILLDEPFYRMAPDPEVDLPGGVLEKAVPLRDGSMVIPAEALKNLDPSALLKVREKDLRGLGLVALVLIVFLFFSFWLGYGEYYLMEGIGQRIMQDIRLELFERMQSQAVRFFDRHPLGRLVTRVTNDIENLNEMFKSVMVTVFKDIFILGGILAVLLYLNWNLALVCFTLLPFIFGLTLLFSFLAREAFRELRAKVAKINAFLQERITGMRIIQLFATEEFQARSFAQINHENYVAGMKQIRVFAIFMPVMDLFSAFAVALVIWYGGGKVISEQLSLGSLVAFVSYIQMFFRPIRDIAEKYNIMQSAMASTERIVEFIDHKEEIPDPHEPGTPTEVHGRIQFEGVSFEYEKDHPVLHDVSFEMKPGEMIAIVGATGAGKSTVVNLIERFYDPVEGKVLLDGVDLRRWRKQELRSHIGLVMQDVFIFSGTLKDNILLGEDGRIPDTLEEAIREANAHTFIQKLPEGIHQRLGEEGSNLSAGERQLLSFARALAYDPKVLILDEATSSVDPETERLIQEAILAMSRKRTTLVVAHRLSTIRRADRILVMHHGRVREQGTHEELMALGGIYYKLNRFKEM